MSGMQNLFAIILAGGSGSRLWPLSREMYPKQLLKLTNEHTLLQSTFLRLATIASPEHIVTVTNIKHLSDIKLQLGNIKELSESDFNIISEPLGKNTAPAIGLSVFYILKKLVNEGTDPVMLVCPSDHLIQNQEKFINNLKEGYKLAENGYIATFGIRPDKPDTGYGYINTEKAENISKISTDALKVQEFKEKPDLVTAEDYLKQGTYFWNSGIFMFKASTIINELNLHTKEIVDILTDSEFNEASPTISFEKYEKMPEISIDYAVMEKSNIITLIPFDCDWNDLGSWQAIYDISDKDERNNFISGNVIDIDSENSLIHSTSKLVSTIGLKNIVLIETDDAILACDKNRTQDVKNIFKCLKDNNDLTCLAHNTGYRPWGYYTVIQRGEGYLIKIINVNPDAKLSLQMHYHRSEHWVVLSGTAKVIKNSEEILLQPGDSIDIPATMKHSLQNPGKIELKIIEIQRGNYLNEDDIIRFEDLYGRVDK